MSALQSEIQIADALARYPLVRKAFELSARRDTAIYLVGGTVRDLLLDRETHDLDFVVQGSGLELARYFANQLGGSFVALDRERGTGRVRMPQTPQYLDITSLRGDDLWADLAGRDFTINAMAIAPAADGKWQIHDPLDGYKDLQDRILRMTSPSSFDSDPVRTLRAVRMQIQFNCTLEPQTRESLCAAVTLLCRVSAERVRDEWFKILQLVDASAALHEMAQLGLFRQVVPPIAHPNILDHALETVHAAERLWAAFSAGHSPGRACELPLAGRLLELAPHLQRRYVTRICDERSHLAMLKCAALLHNVAVDAAGLSERWRLSKREAELLRIATRHYGEVEELVEHAGLTRRSVYRFFSQTGEPGIDAALLFLAHTLAARNLAPTQGAWIQLTASVGRLLEAWFEHRDTQVSPTPLLSGNDVMRALGQPPGPQVGALLKQLSEEQAAGEILTRQQAIEFIRTWSTREVAAGKGGEHNSSRTQG